MDVFNQKLYWDITEDVTVSLFLLEFIPTPPTGEAYMGLALADRKELEAMLKAAAKDPRVATTLAGRMVPGQGDAEEFAYGLLAGMVIGSFMASFEGKNGRQPDRDETSDLLSIVMSRMPALRKAITKQRDMR